MSENIRNKTNPWLTAKRLRMHGMILALCLWSLYIWTIATPTLRDRNGKLKGTDFLHLYTLGSLAITQRGADLYDMNAQARIAAERVPQAAGIRYLSLYPPQVSVFFSAFAHFSYGWALVLWWAFSGFTYVICCYRLWRACPNLRNHGPTVALLAVAFPAFFHLIAWGQTSALALACFTLMFFFLRDRREVLAGLALGCLIFKPQLGLAAGIVFLGTGRWKIVCGAVLSATAQLAVGVLYYGIEPLRRWLQMLWDVPSLLALLEPKPYQTHCLRTFWSMIVPWPAISLAWYLLSAVFVLSLTLSLWRRKLPLAVRYSVLLLATVLVSPHLTVYDLVILAPAILLLADWLIPQDLIPVPGEIGILLYLVYMLPLLGPLTRWTHVQLSVVAMTALVYAIWYRSRAMAA